MPDSSRTQDEFYIPPIKLGEVTEFFVLALAGVQQLSPDPAITGLCESTWCAFPPLHPLFGTQSDARWTTTRRRYLSRSHTGGNEKMDKHKGNQQIPFA